MTVGTDELQAKQQKSVRRALGFYKILAYSTGILLLLVCGEVVLRYGLQLVLIAGGTELSSNTAHTLGFVTVEPQGFMSVEGGLNLSTTLLIVHGWVYLIYLVAGLRLWSRMQWNLRKLIMIALGGVIPVLSFLVEYRARVAVETTLAAGNEPDEAESGMDR